VIFGANPLIGVFPLIVKLKVVAWERHSSLFWLSVSEEKALKQLEESFGTRVTGKLKQMGAQVNSIAILHWQS
jgi:hypothetical protein